MKVTAIKQQGGTTGVYEEVKQALQDIVAPELRTLQAEIKRLDEKIDPTHKRLNEKIESIHSGLFSEIKRLDEKLSSEIKRLDEKIIDIAIQIRERLAFLEAKVAALTK
jgi:peptidoglycan hydrolase CwlO-like protein